MSTMVNDHTLIVEDFKTRVKHQEKKYEELLKQYHKHDD